jgi:hypothetical protein
MEIVEQPIYLPAQALEWRPILELSGRVGFLDGQFGGSLSHGESPLEWTDCSDAAASALPPFGFPGGARAGVQRIRLRDVIADPVRRSAAAFANASFASLRPIQLDPARISANGLFQLPSLMRIKTAGAMRSLGGTCSCSTRE